MKKLYLILSLIVLFVTSSCSSTRYIYEEPVYGTSQVVYDNDYYNVAVFNGDALLNMYEYARIVSLEGFVGGYTRVIIDVNGLIYTVSGPTILISPIAHPRTVYRIYGASFYRWHPERNVFIYTEPPRYYRRPRPRPRPDMGPNNPRPNDRPVVRRNEQPRRVQPSDRPNDNQSRRIQQSDRPNNNQPRQQQGNQQRVQQNNQTRTQQQATPRSNGTSNSTRSTQSSGGNRQGQGGGGRR